jgi:hypothetical protein
MSQRNGGMFDWQKSSLYRVALLLTVSGCVALVTLGAVSDAPWKPGDPIGYISAKIPKVTVPPYKGDKYQATVPDTLDLAERARVAINALTEVTNPDEDFEIYNTNSFATNPPSMEMHCWYPTLLPKFMWALSMMREMSGSDQNLQVDQRWLEVALKMQGPDGLIYAPIKGRPWALNGFQVRDTEMPKEQILQPFVCAVMMGAMANQVERDPQGPWKDSLRRLVDGMIELAVVDGDKAYYWPSCILATKNHPVHPEMPTRPFDAEGTVVPHGLVHAYKVLHYQPALDLAKKYINYLRENFYAPDGTFWSSPGQPAHAHSHAHARGVLAMEEYAEVTGDKEVMDFVVKAFNFYRNAGVNFTPAKEGSADYDLVRTPGAGLIGFFPEWTGAPELQTNETCPLADMIAIAVRLSESGVGDYWDDADRWIRNQFAENQLLEIDWIYALSKKYNKTPNSGPSVSTDHVPERNLGAFASHAGPNDWDGRDYPGIAHCCTANGCKTLFWVWERLLTYDDGKLKVNLLMNRASPWADVDSYIPYKGRVDVKVKQPLQLSIRIPEWVTPDQAHCEIDGQDRKLSWDGRYAVVGNVDKGDIVKLTFPISERTDEVWIEKRPYKIVRKGNEVVSIDPPGEQFPLYQRDYYRSDKPRMREVTRFVTVDTPVN